MTEQTRVRAEVDVEVVAAGLGAHTLRMTPRYMYVVGGGAGLIRVTRADGVRSVIVRDFVSGLESDDEAVYYASREGIFRVLHGEERATSLAKEDAGLYMALDDDFIYFTRFQKPGVFRLPKAGGEPTQLIAEKRPGEIVVDDKHVYFASFFRNRVARFPKSGGPVTRMRPHGRGPVGLAQDADTVFLLQETTGEVVRIDKSLRARSTLARGQTNPSALLLSEEHVYWTSGATRPDEPGVVRRLPKDGGSPETLATYDGSLSVLSLDGGWLYVSVSKEDAIVRLRLPV